MAVCRAAEHPDKAIETVWSRPLVREATPDDIPAMLTMAERFIAIAWGRIGVPFDPETCRELLIGLMDSQKAILLVDDGCNAMIGVVIHPWHFNRNVLTATELFWWAEPRSTSAMALWQAAERSAREMGAKTFNMGLQDHLRADALAKLYARRGYAPSEHIFITELN